LYPITPVVFCLACGYLAYSSISYAASKEAVHISLWVMALGVAALVVLRYLGARTARVGAT
jgi:ABC-type sulfate transport system permease component